MIAKYYIFQFFLLENTNNLKFPISKSTKLTENPNYFLQSHIWGFGVLGYCQV